MNNPIQNLAHIYTSIANLHSKKMLWHMDDSVEDCFDDLSIEEQKSLETLQENLWNACSAEGIDIHCVCLDVIYSVAGYENFKQKISTIEARS